MAWLVDLWAGRLSLSTAFWTYAVFWAFFVNLTALAVSLLAITGVGPAGSAPTENWRLYVAVLAHIVPIPFNAVVLVGVWRSAGRPENSRLQRIAAKLAMFAWATLLLLAYLIIP